MTKGKVLIVEDEPDLRNVYEIILKHAGYDVYTATNGQQGLEEVKATQPNIVLLDIFMPVMDGAEFLKTVPLDEYPNMKVVVYSNTSDNVLRDSMLELGAQEVINKSSMAPRDLVSLIDRYNGTAQ